MSQKISKINELIKQHINDIIVKDLSLKDGVFITIAKVDTTSDLQYTRIFVSVFPQRDTKYVMTALKRELFQMQGQLNKLLRMNRFPKIEFRLDTTEAKADEIEKILRDLR